MDVRMCHAATSEGVEKMTVKRDSIVDSIRRLPPGSKVSVRGLAEELGVSVGTAHKAVRLAEELGLVQVVPRSGTFRSDDACRETGPEGLLLSNVIERLGSPSSAGPDMRTYQ